MKENVLLDELKAHFESVLAVRNLAFKCDEKLLNFLLDSKFKDEFRKRFFAEICGNLVFKREDFLDFLDLQSRKLGFTKFSNKIGLGFLNATYHYNQEKIVLNFPFKDCVLKGGQDKDDAKTKEIFFNEILARSDIDVLFEPKVLQNFELVERSVSSATHTQERERERERQRRA